VKGPILISMPVAEMSGVTFLDSDSAPDSGLNTSVPTPKNLKHQLRLLITLRNLPSNSYQKDSVYFAQGRIWLMRGLRLIHF